MTDLIFTVLFIEAFLLPALIGGGIALGMGIIIMIAARVFFVPVDEKMKKLVNILPGINCGACGYSGCEEYANALRNGETDDAGKCPVGGAATASELAEFLGLEIPDFTPQAAHVFCHGTLQHTSKRFDYSGTVSCAAAHGLFSGPNSCTYGCLGFGDCAQACPYDAIYMADGIAHVDSLKCTACGLCVKTCPKLLIEIIPKHLNTYTVKCKNKWPGAQTRKNCSIGCIGCRMCYKTCRFDAISMDGPLAVIDQEKCTRCGECLDVCPTGTIHNGLMLAPDAENHPRSSGLHLWVDPKIRRKQAETQKNAAKHDE